MLLPFDMREWLPPDHLVWFVLETVDALDTAALERTRRLRADAVEAALDLMPAQHRWPAVERMGGLLSITPDRLPLLGPFDILWNVSDKPATYLERNSLSPAAIAQARANLRSVQPR